MNILNKYNSRAPVKRMGNTEDLHAVILYLSSEKSDYVLGQNIVIDGGLSLT
tara:strand:+ start:744 stop:899 length:156 start_codon:yes stop_codon:yes gene_type:complete